MKKWLVIFCDEFESEFDELSVTVQDELLARAKLLAKNGARFGTTLCRYTKRLEI